MNKNLIRLTESSILVALAVVLEFISKIPILQMPQGGTVSLAMLPIFIIAFRHGYYYGFLSGLVYGIVNFFIDNYAFYWGSFLFDYTLAFMVLGFAAITRKKALEGNLFYMVSGIWIGAFLRYLMHGLSGVLFFAKDADNYNVWLYSFIIYNGPYMFVSTIACTLVLLFTYKRLLLLNLV